DGRDRRAVFRAERTLRAVRRLSAGRVPRRVPQDRRTRAGQGAGRRPDGPSVRNVIPLYQKKPPRNPRQSEALPSPFSAGDLYHWKMYDKMALQPCRVRRGGRDGGTRARLKRRNEAVNGDANFFRRKTHTGADLWS